MAYLHNDGELLVLNGAFDGRTVEIGLFDNSTDALAEDSTYADITSEPVGSNYAPQSVSNHTISQNENGNAELNLGEISFDVGDSDVAVDYIYVRDSSSGDLIFTSELEQTYDLGSVDVLDLTNVGMAVE
ncbi:hypothetical protein [Natrialba asiatica]|uniref:Uncharacterized protein n=1 Tax=Natrialba asiatica (strain ATCC 700177 / DSM 12278 / JCM 9576 / FERM P-10747 / NBRC 102637 / 172P1) TaxID=29540 RepID=M0AS44_NATA1|nr:hypothetical protein [Natrialba asiatica]ELZ00773.1 hypothetical protein C481_11080 [Natrialba asiatica DSM 12278]